GGSHIGVVGTAVGVDFHFDEFASRRPVYRRHSPCSWCSATNSYVIKSEIIGGCRMGFHIFRGAAIKDADLQAQSLVGQSMAVVVPGYALVVELLRCLCVGAEAESHHYGCCEC